MAANSHSYQRLLTAPTSSDEQHRGDQEAGTLEAEISRLVERRCSVLRARNGLSPINGLPFECLSSIFLLAQQAELDDLRPDNPSADDEWPYPSCHASYKGRVPLTLSQVCSRWRLVALGTSRLWTKMTLLLGNYTHSERKQAFQREMLSPYLERIASVSNLDLDIRYFPGEARDGYEKDGLASFTLKKDLNVLIPYFGKCRRLCAHVPSTLVESRLLSDRLLWRFPDLKCLLLRSGDRSTAASVTMPFDTPRLKMLTLDHVRVFNVASDAFDDLSILRLDTSSLKFRPEAMDMSDDTIQKLRGELRHRPLEVTWTPLLLSFIQSCRGLENLLLRHIAISTSINAQTVTLSNLVRLDLCIPPDPAHDNLDEQTRSPIAHIIRHIEMPALRRCALDGSKYQRPGEEDIIRALAVARPSLVELVLTNFRWLKHGLCVDLLSALPGLEKLTFTAFRYLPEVLPSLLVTSECMHVPKLQCLWINDMRLSPDDTRRALRKQLIAALRHILQSRFESTAVATVDEFGSVFANRAVEGQLDSLKPWVRRLTVRVAIPRPALVECDPPVYD